MKKPATNTVLPPKDVLIVEDSATQAAVLKIALEKHGWRVRVAGDGVAALEQARLSKPDIVVSDIRMPRMDGYALSKAIKTDPALRDVPVILFTSLSQSCDIIDAINSRANYYFLKQWDHDVLIAKIASVLATYQPVSDHGGDGLRVHLEGKTYTIEASAQQPLTLLLSTYEIAVQQSMALAAARDKLREANEALEATVRERTAQFIASETRYRRLFEAAKDGILILDAETGMVVDVNPFLAGLLGFSHEQFLGKTIWELGFLKDVIANRDNFRELQQKGYARYEHLPLERMNGSPLDVEVVSNVYMAGDKKVIQCNIRDVTERTVRERQQKLAMQVLATLNRGNDVALLVKDILQLIKESMGFEAVGIRLRDGGDFPYCETNGFAGTFVEAERHLCARDAAGELIRDADGNPILECMCGNVLRGRTDPAKPFFTPNGSFWTNSTTELLASTIEKDRQSRTRNRCNGRGYESVALIPVRSGDLVLGLIQFNDHRKGMFTLDMIRFFEGLGASIGIAVKRRQNAAALREAEARYRTLFENAQDGMAVAEAETGKLVDCNRALCRLLERERADLEGQPQSVLHAPGDLVNGVSPTFLTQRQHACGPAGEDRLLSKSGKVIPVEVSGTHLHMNGQDYLMGVFRDITERKQAEAEHEKLQAQFTQAQKMESVGRLAGGVAHDFNNLLMGIMGYTQLCLDKIAPDHRIREWLDEINKDVERSARLTHQLLAFARKQIIAPKVLDVNETIEGMLKLIRRLIGEDIAVKWLPGSGIWPVKMDPGQIDQILANLAVNARDAIGGVGSIAIETGEVTFDQAYCAEHPGSEPGDYVCLTASDTGCGMDRETLEHIFEPFFTTKVPGEGTGLGLATVFGIVKQNDGFINVYSEPGKGTTFKIYLPRFATPEAASVAVEKLTKPPRGNEIVLLVEDEKSIRVTTSAFLEDLGYTLLVAEDPAKALRLVAEHPGEIHLLITDVIMPGMSGRDLANRLLELRPTIKRLFISGFTADVIAQRGILDDGVNFLSKPFGRDALARKVREVLDA